MRKEKDELHLGTCLLTVSSRSVTSSALTLLTAKMRSPTAKPASAASPLESTLTTCVPSSSTPS